MAQHSFHLPPPLIFVNRGGYETNSNPQFNSFGVIIQKHYDCDLHCILYLCIRPDLQCMPEKTLIAANFSLLSSLPPPTSDIVIDKIPHPPEKCQLKPTTPSGNKMIAVHGGGGGGAWIFARTALSPYPARVGLGLYKYSKKHASMPNQMKCHKKLIQF